jgi:predicted GNAT family acetyltransferase
VVEDAGSPVAAAVRTPPHNVVLSQTASLDALDLFARDLHEAGQALPGVVASSAVSLAFADRWHALTGQRHRRAEALRISQLEAVKPVIGVPGHLRRATVDDQALLVDWSEAFSREVHNEADRSEIERSVQQTLATDPNVRGLYIWHDGAPVSMAGFSGPTPNGSRVGPVYTPPALRRKGYASACVAALSQHLLDSGRKFCFLFTDLANPTSNHIYQAIGYVPVCDVDDYRFG